MVRRKIVRFAIPRTGRPKEKHNARRILMGYIAAPLAVLLVPLLLGIVYYAKTLDIVKTDAVNENVAILRQASLVLDQRFREASDLADQIIASDSVSVIRNAMDPMAYPNSYSLIEARMDLMNRSVVNRFIWNYFIFFDRSRMVMNNQIIYPYDAFYRHYLRFRNMDADAWARYVSSPRLSSGVSGETGIERIGADGGVMEAHTVIAYTKPLVSYGQYDGMIMVLIRKEDMTDLLASIDTSHGGITYIEDRKGQVVTSYSVDGQDVSTVQRLVREKGISGRESTEIMLDGQPMLVNSVRSGQGDYTYVAVQSKDIVLAQANSVRTTLFVVLLLSILAGTAIAYVAARSNARPVQEILAHLPVRGSGEDAFDQIREAISDLSRNKGLLEDTLRAQRPILRTTFLERLLRGDFLTRDQLEPVLESIGLACNGNGYHVLLFRFDVDIDQYDSLDLTIVASYRQMLKEALSVVVPEALACDLDELQVALLLEAGPLSSEGAQQPVATGPMQSGERLLEVETGPLATPENRLSVEMVVRRIRERLPGPLARSMLVAGSDRVVGLIEVPEAFERAKQAFRINHSQVDSQVLWHAEMTLGEKSYHFPVDQGTRLDALVRAGDRDGVRDVLQALFHRNFIDTDLAPTQQKLFLYDLMGCLVRLAGQIGLTAEASDRILGHLEQVDKGSDLMRIRWIMDTYFQLCDRMADQQAKPVNGTIAQVVAHVAAHCFDSNLSLASLADRFRVNESYLSYAFRQQTGEKLSVHIEDLRIRKAQSLLAETDLSINDIAERTGYLSLNTFCRAFKRVTGTNATAFRTRQAESRPGR